MKTQSISATDERDIKGVILLTATHTRSYSRLYVFHATERWKNTTQTSLLETKT